MREQRIDGGQPAPQYGVVHRVVVHEGREMDQLNDGGERHRTRILGPCRLVTEQEQRRPEQLSLHLQEVSFTSLTMGKSAAMTRRSSTTTCSSSPATGRWTS